MPLERVKLAILGDGATQPVAQALSTALRERGFKAELYEGGHDACAQEILDESSGLYRFKPDYVLLNVAMPRLRERWHGAGRQADFDRSVHAELTTWWKLLLERLECRVIQNLYAPPVEREFGNFSLKVPASFPCVVARLNAGLCESARERPRVLINDVEQLSALIGRERWQDERFWQHARLFCGPAHLPRFAQGVAAILSAAAGRAPKCLVLDLDGTLWSGVVGDEGAGEAHGDFQRFLLSLRARGILLAVCSSNEPELALAPFHGHEGMVLKEGDFAAFIANRDDKPRNLKHIAQSLGLGLEHLAFIDDSPFERALMRATLPEVVVPELPEDPADFAAALSAAGLFETTNFTAEDAVRANHYAAQSRRDAVRAQATDLDAYLKSLEMRPVARPLSPENAARVAQLAARSNQFNLTTVRYTEADCEKLSRDPARDVVCVSLSDKFGDYGLVAALVIKAEKDSAEIEAWFMSCRVLQRGLEKFCLDEAVAIARAKKLKRLVGRYRATPKNALVREHYARLGFTRVSQDARGSEWVLTL